MKVVIVNGQGGVGKALTNDTILPTPTGPCAVKDIKVGDFLFDRAGKPTRVLGVFP
jgi:replicative DNA helicase